MFNNTLSSQKELNQAYQTHIDLSHITNLAQVPKEPNLIAQNVFNNSDLMMSTIITRLQVFKNDI